MLKFKRGDHVCVFYHDQTSLLEMLVPYLLDGLRNGERCFCAQTSAMIRRLVPALRRAGLDVEDEIRRGALEIHTEEEVYFPDGRFEPTAMIELLKASISEAERLGFTGLRTAGELSWAASGKCDCDQLLFYEEMVESVFPRSAAIGLCQYPIAQFSPEALGKVLEKHRHAVQQTTKGSAHCSLSTRHGRYSLDIISDRLDPLRYYYVVQRTGSPEILNWGVEREFEAAARMGRFAIADLEQPGGAPGAERAN